MILFAVEECKRRIGDSIEYANDMYDAVSDADALFTGYRVERVSYA